jgi:hypothetical protein
MSLESECQRMRMACLELRACVDKNADTCTQTLFSLQGKRDIISCNDHEYVKVFNS